MSKRTVLIGSIVIVIVAALAALYSDSLGARFAVSGQFAITGPDTLTQGKTATITWKYDAKNAARYPSEKIEFCRGRLFGQNCLLLAADTPNDGEETLTIPNLPVGKGYIRLTARRQPRGFLLTDISTTRPVIVVELAAAPTTPPKSNPPGTHTPTTTSNPTSAPSSGANLYGKVALQTGDCMPVIGPGSTCKTSLVARQIYVRKQASFADMQVTYLKNKTALVAQGKSDANGQYQIQVPPGTYSVFVEDQSQEYCNLFGMNLEPCPVTVGIAAVEYNIRIDHATH